MDEDHEDQAVWRLGPGFQHGDHGRGSGSGRHTGNALVTLSDVSPSSSAWRSQSTRSRPLGRCMTSSSPTPACGRRVWSSGEC